MKKSSTGAREARLRMIERTVNRADDTDDISAAEARARMIHRLYRKDGEDDDIQWITVKGTHIPLKDGKAIGGPLKGEKFKNAETVETPKKAENKHLTAENQSVKIADKQNYYAAANGYGGGYGNNSGDNGNGGNNGGYKRPNNPKSKIRSYSKATTIEEAEAEARQIFAEVDYSKFADVETARRVNDTLFSINAMFPFHARKIITDVALDSEFFSTHAFTDGRDVVCYFNNKYNTGDMSISASSMHEDFRNKNEANLIKYGNLANDYAKEIQGLTRAKSMYTDSTVIKLYDSQIAKRMEEYNVNYDNYLFCKENRRYSRWLAISDGFEVESHIAHEVGHILSDQHCGLLYPDEFSYDSEVTQKKREKVNSCYQRALYTDDILQISGYARTMVQEFFAECFAMYMTGQPLPIYLQEMIEEVLDDRL